MRDAVSGLVSSTNLFLFSSFLFLPLFSYKSNTTTFIPRFFLHGIQTCLYRLFGFCNLSSSACNHSALTGPYRYYCLLLLLLQCGSMSVCIPSLCLSQHRSPLFVVMSVKTILYNIRRQAHPPRHQMLPSDSFCWLRARQDAAARVSGCSPISRRSNLTP